MLDLDSPSTARSVPRHLSEGKQFLPPATVAKCKVLPIAPSTYHAHIAQRIDASKRSARAQRDAELKIEVQRVFAENFGVYGVRKVWRQLRREGFTVARCTVERLMASLGLQGAIRGKPVRTTISDKAVPCPLDHVNRQFHALRPRMPSGSRTSPTSQPGAGFVYVAFVIDAYAPSYRGLACLTDSTCELRARCAGAGPP
jgi:putative transposase